MGARAGGAFGAFGTCTVYRLGQRVRTAAAAGDIMLAAVAVVPVVYVLRGAFARQDLLAEARRHLSYVLRGRPREPGVDDRIVQAIIDNHTRPVGCGRMMTADPHALYPSDTEDQAVLRPLARSRTAALCERAVRRRGARRS
ncbi:hypothetical protein ACH4JS_22940 [Streptomyces sp. NPDC017638]|uniref:hypothetical protein n=1 Tax=Streptomyces sp. NPDC017638 TaxID=3365004 RepID=UPI003797E8CC